MSNLKKYLFSFLITCLSIILTFLLATTLYYFNIISPSTYNILKLIFLLLSLFVNSFVLGKNALKKGYLEGLKLSIPLILLFLIITLFNQSFTFKNLLYYLILIITASFGSMVGISRKKEL